MGRKDTLIVDCQVFQTDAWDRGMGKYSLGLLRGLVASKGWDKRLVFCFSKHLPYGDEVKKTLRQSFPQAEEHMVDLHRTDQAGVAPAQEHNKTELLAHFGKERLSASDFLILALFIDKACPVFPAYARSFLLFYDIIPHLYNARYLPSDESQEKYYRHYATVFAADCILTISETVRDDLISYLGLLPDKIVSIDGGAIDRSALTAKESNLSQGKKFILMPSGDDIRKNNLFAVQGFEAFNQRHDNEYKLLVTSFFSPDTQKKLKEVSDNVVFTGNVTESELQWLYEHANMVLFATEYEGLGLPILEAVAAKRIVVCSDIPVFQEISESAFYMFDPYEQTALVEALERAQKQTGWAKKKGEYAGIVKRYTWEETTSRVIKRLDTDGATVTPRQKLRVAVFCPDPSGYSAIGKVVSELHPSLTELFTIDYYFDKGESQRHVRANYLQYVAQSYDTKQFTATQYQQYDAVLYHIGNSEYHISTIRAALCYPGFIICHEKYLTEIFELMAARGLISPERYTLEKQLNAAFSDEKSAFLTTLGNAQLGVVTHSDYAAKALAEVIVEDVKQTRLNLPVPSPSHVRRPKNIRLKIGLAGVLTGNKGLSIIETLATNAALRDVDFHIFGYKISDLAVLDRLQAHGNVTVESDLSDFDYQRQLAALDVLVCYRESYRGETSLTVLEAMRQGTVVVVRDIGWFSELPDTAVVRVASKQQLVESVASLSRDAAARDRISRGAVEIVQQGFSEHQYAKGLHRLIAGVLAETSSRNFALSQVLCRADAYQKIQPLIKEIIEN